MLRPVFRAARGCRLYENRRMDRKTAEEFVSASLDLGFNFFDHADIYGGGKCEEVFGDVLKTDASMRDKIFIQTKCGIRSGMYDFSK